MITITSSCLVTPSEETPKCSLWLSESDQIMRYDHTPVIYIYKGNQNNFDNVTQKVKDSLSKLLVYYYPAAGRLSWLEGGRTKIECNSKGVLLIEARSTKKLADYGDFSPNQPIKELIPTVDYSQPKDEIPLVLAQITRFCDGNGISIGLNSCHQLSDGIGFTQFTNAWAKLTRGEELGQDEIPFLDRTVLKSSNLSSSPRFDHMEFKPLPFKTGFSDHKTEQKKEVAFKLLKLTPKQVLNLKKSANNNNNGQVGSKGAYSRFEAIGAHIWRCASKARDLDETQQSVVAFVGDFRSRIDPSLPQNYFGNALTRLVTEKCYVGEIISKPISYSAQKMREAVEKLSNEYIRSQLDFIAQKKEISCFRTTTTKLTQENEDAPFYGNPNLYLISWISLPIYEADFGWGKPHFVGQGSSYLYDRATIALSPDGDGSILVFLNFQVAHFDKFIKFFWEDICDV